MRSKMKINWKLRRKNKHTMVAIIATVILLFQQIGIKVPENTMDIVNTVLTLMVLLGVIADPTTKGLGDTNQVMLYEEPKNEDSELL